LGTTRDFDVRAYNRAAWDGEVERGNRWTVPVEDEDIAAARRGDWQILLTPSKPVPRAWFPDVAGADVLCLASGGGQQGPILAAAGASVTVLDNSPLQLERDSRVAERHRLPVRTVEGDMADLSAFPSASFDLIVHPVSNCFVPEVRPVWAECFRVLRAGGVVLAGFNNPAVYLFDYDLMEEEGLLQVKYPLPYADLTSLSAPDLKRYVDAGEPLAFSHTLEDQIGGQLDAGFVLTGLYEDVDAGEEADLLNDYLPPFIATRATKP